MALANYADLKATIADRLSRGDLTSQIPDFIRLGEVRLNGNLRIEPMVTRVTIQTTAAQEYVDQPSGFLELRRIKIDGSPLKNLSYVTPEQMDGSVAGSVDGKPDVYTFIGTRIYLAPVPDAVYDITTDYYKAFDTLSDGTQTNWLITNAPDAYLYASLLEAFLFVRNEAEARTYADLLSATVDRLKIEDERRKYGGSVLMVRAEVSIP